MDASIALPSTPSQTAESSAGWSRFYRAVGLVYGFANQILFAITVWYLFWFLHDGKMSSVSAYWMIQDCGLAMVFAISHSVMLVPKIRKYLCRWIPQAFYDSTFCVVTCVSLLTLFWGWRSSEITIWHASGATATIIRVCFYFSWCALFYSLALTGLGYQNGWTPFYHWIRRERGPRREFRPRGAYKLIRHPVYLSFLGLVWFTPHMSLDHAALTAIWTGYIFYGSYLKDRRLERFIGEPYRQYESQVAGYPLMPAGPLAKRVSP